MGVGRIHCERNHTRLAERGRVSRYHDDMGRAVASENEAAGFFASILSGFLLGFGLDAWMTTRPLFTVIGIITGSVVGFWRMWQVAKRVG